MPSDPKTKTPTEREQTSAAEVRAYLRRHPDFLEKSPDLLVSLVPPARRHGDGVVDMQRIMIERLQAEIRRLNGHHDELVAASRSNMASQGQIHGAVLSLLQARDFRHLIGIATEELKTVLELDAVALCVESDDPSGLNVKTPGVHVVPEGAVDEIIGEGRDILLRSSVLDERRIYRNQGGVVRSDALIRLALGESAPVGLLALGAAEEEKFHLGQGTELLSFLGKALEYCIRSWLARGR
jgi:uncharacterized protein YigA (DUF484 family)